MALRVKQERRTSHRLLYLHAPHASFGVCCRSNLRSCEAFCRRKAFSSATNNFSLSCHGAWCKLFLTAYDAGRSRDFRGATAANVPSAGMTLYQTDYAFLPVQPTTSSSGWKLTTHVRRPSRLRERRPVPWSWLLGDGCHLNHSIGASSPRQGLDRRANFLESALSS